MNKINILVYFCYVSALVSSSQSLIQSAFVAKQSNGTTILADSACSNTIVNDPNLTTRNTSLAMIISIKQANGDLIPVIIQGDLAIFFFFFFETNFIQLVVLNLSHLNYIKLYLFLTSNER